jgi:ferritin-like metal-binding protein YciE
MKRKADTTLKDLLIIKLRALYDIETQLVKALPKMAKKATEEELVVAFEDHLRETQVHVERLEHCSENLDIKPAKIKVEGIRGIIADAEWVMKNVSGPMALDANLIAAAQYIEHYEMAGYASAAEWAKTIGALDVADLLITTLEEEKAASQKLERLATSGINDRVVDLQKEDNEDA